MEATMRHGNLRRCERGPRTQRGIAYFGVLILIAAVGLGMTQAARVWRTVQQRDREARLLFVGDQYRAAIGRYYSAAGQTRYPASLDALLDDRRTLPAGRYLRRLYPDPLSGTAAWGIIKAPDGGVMGVVSEAAGRPLKRRGFPARYAEFADRDTYRAWRFVFLPSASGDSPARPADN
ncbi:type II secretion system protein [Burkholderia sp. 22PA0106]|uniref:type II secretion system protein n=1 Tax=Burkholderia sp. 22PA0106 TaxID=3237371 RepID=UPI0039C0F80E